MSSRAFRVKKSGSMLVSLYSLAGIAGLGYLTLIFMVSFNLLSQFSLQSWDEVYILIKQSLNMIGVSLLIALPVTIAITFFIVSNFNSRLSYLLESILRMIDQAPLVIYGVVFLVLFSSQWWVLYVVGSMIVIPKLSYRWIKLSNMVQVSEIETVKSLGMNFWQIVKVLYLRRFIKMYLGHLSSVVCFLFGVVTPFICFIAYKEDYLGSFSVHLFNDLGRRSEKISLMITILLFIQAFRVWFDSKAIYHEVENG